MSETSYVSTHTANLHPKGERLEICIILRSLRRKENLRLDVIINNRYLVFPPIRIFAHTRLVPPKYKAIFIDFMREERMEEEGAGEKEREKSIINDVTRREIRSGVAGTRGTIEAWRNDF